ncbi:MAG: response regulator [Pseudomonadota bacterium]
MGNNTENKPGRIVFVDDDNDIRQVVRDSFQMADVSKDVVIATCGSGGELLKRLNELQPALILLDLHMPGMNGIDFIHTLRDHKDGAHTPVIFLTGETRVEMKKQYEDIGVIGVIHKPFDVKTLPEQTFAIWRSEGFTGEEGQVLTDLMEEDTNTFKETN